MRERDLLDHIYQSSRGLGDRITVPPGDDMGAVRIRDVEVLVTVDQLGQGVHFDLKKVPIEKVGRKAIKRSLSDVAAMGALPAGAVVAVSLPRNFESGRAEVLFDSMRSEAVSYDCPLFGGDISIWDEPLLVSVTVLGRTEGVAPLCRRGAEVGDVVCVTGTLGGSLETVDGYTHHLDFEPRLRAARALAKGVPVRPHCMIDLSDGLATDLAHLCRASGVAALVDAEKLPTSPGGRAAAVRDQQPSWQHAICDGEDYELCFTVAADRAEALAGKSVEGVAVSCVGTIVDNDGGPVVRMRLVDGSIQPVVDGGWEHLGS